MQTLHNPELRAVGDIRREWAVACGGVTLVVLLSLWVAPLWQPVMEVAVAFAIKQFGPHRRRSHTHPCGRLANCVFRALILTAIVSCAINILYYTDLIHIFFNPATLNNSIPFITSLIVFPILFITAFINASGPVCEKHNRQCHLHNEYNPAQPHFSRAVHGVYRRLLNYTALISFVITVIDWAYYSLLYQNANLNLPDRFFFFIIPAAVYVWSLFYVHEHYTSVLLPSGRPAIGQNSSDSASDCTILRFLIIHNDRLLLDVSPEAVVDCKIDIPVVVYDKFSEHYSIERATEKFAVLSCMDPTEFEVKELYSTKSHNLHNIVRHYLVNIPEPDENAPINADEEDRHCIELSSRIGGEWITIDGIDRYMKMGVVSPLLNAEIYRIYTIVMAWKAYDKGGRRRYPIRHYRPTFRLRDVYKWDVDFNDLHWMRVARINEDAPLWFIRRHFLK